ncbi:hypothetical protein AMTR_s02163p00007920 [Amborella trichopoda]|uniref:Uncharacterized protein n=1 Tax=Amborella trichopoda TaxID=13333 RepID=U5CKX7_AMBTC|nr:hypothetical protein AMTR_s02163p00007920 [Amborella trichopoda]
MVEHRRCAFFRVVTSWSSASLANTHQAQSAHNPAAPTNYDGWTTVHRKGRRGRISNGRSHAPLDHSLHGPRYSGSQPQAKIFPLLEDQSLGLEDLPQANIKAPDTSPPFFPPLMNLSPSLPLDGNVSTTPLSPCDVPSTPTYPSDLVVDPHSRVLLPPFPQPRVHPLLFLRLPHDFPLLSPCPAIFPAHLTPTTSSSSYPITPPSPPPFTSSVPPSLPSPTKVLYLELPAPSPGTHGNPQAPLSSHALNSSTSSFALDFTFSLAGATTDPSLPPSLVDTSADSSANNSPPSPMAPRNRSRYRSATHRRSPSLPLATIPPPPPPPVPPLSPPPSPTPPALPCASSSSIPPLALSSFSSPLPPVLPLCSLFPIHPQRLPSCA